MLFGILLLAAPLPADVWSVGTDGKSCVQLEPALAAELSTWKVDSESSAPDEGIFGRVNPKNPRQLVLLFASERVCERIVWAVGEAKKENRPSQTLNEKQMREKVEAIAATDLKALWPKLSAKEKKAIHDDAKVLFAGDANRVKVRKVIASLAKKKKPSKADRARLELWKALHHLVFAEPYEEKGK